MKLQWWRLAIASCLPAVIAGSTLGCSDDANDPLPECIDGSPPGRTDGPRLAGAPSFGASEIPPGTPVILSVPVNDLTREVDASLRSEDTGQSFPQDTNGGTTVEFDFGELTVPGGPFWAGTISVTGEDSTDKVYYIPNDDLTTYEFSFGAGEEFDPLCQTPYAPPTFIVTE